MVHGVRTRSFFFLAVALYLTLLSLFYTLPTYLFPIEVEEAYLDVESKDSTPFFLTTSQEDVDRAVPMSIPKF